MRKYLILGIICLLTCTLVNAQIIRIEVVDELTQKPNFGAIVTNLKTQETSKINQNGFAFLTLKVSDSISILYLNSTIKEVYNGLNPWLISFPAFNSEKLKTVSITHHKQKEKLRESPVTLERLSAKDIKETPAADFYEGLGNLRGVDVATASMGFKVINTRGFNSTSPVRSLQLIDGVDNQSPGLNFSLGNFLGACELDIQTTDIIVGASSSYYGPNAFNGVVNMVTKNMWKDTGFSAQLKVGERNLAQIMLRYSKVLKNKKGRQVFAYKFNASYMRAYDWEANNSNPTNESTVGKNNPGNYDAINRYGDEIFGTSKYDQVDNNSKVLYPGLGAFYRDGYWEKDLVNYNTFNLKTCLTLAYKFKNNGVLEYGGNFGTGNTIYQGDNRYALRGILFTQNRLEYKYKNDFIRFYATHEDAGKTYDAVVTAFLLQNHAKQSDLWYSDYQNYWQNFISNKVKTTAGYPTGNPITNPNWYQQQALFLANNANLLNGLHSQARAAANKDKDYQGLNRIDPMYNKLVPGTDSFKNLLKYYTNKLSFGGEDGLNGSLFFDKSALYHLAGEKTLVGKSALWKIGFSSRLYAPYSKGTIFRDSGANRIRNWEAGVYGGIEKRFFKNKLKMDITARLDKNQNFNPLFSPAVSFVYSKTKTNTFRVSLNSAIRNPTLQDQYLFYNVGRAILIGNIDGVNNVYELDNFVDYLNSRNRANLKAISVKAIQPEKVRTLELSYKGTLVKNKVTLDIGTYASRYVDFIGYKLVVDAIIDTNINFLKSAQAYRIATNSADVVYTYGASAGANYFFNKFFALTANWSWNKLDRGNATDNLIPAFNTPRHKVNIGFGGSDLRFIKNKFKLQNWGFNANWKWVEGFIFEGSPQFTGFVPSYNTIDLQVSKTFPRIQSTLKIGASNLTNLRYFQVFGGPVLGRMAYVSFTWEPK